MSSNPAQAAAVARDPAVQAVLDSVLATPSDALLERARAHAAALPAQEVGPPRAAGG